MEEVNEKRKQKESVRHRKKKQKRKILELVKVMNEIMIYMKQLESLDLFGRKEMYKQLISIYSRTFLVID